MSFCSSCLFIGSLPTRAGAVHGFFGAFGSFRSHFVLVQSSARIAVVIFIVFDLAPRSGQSKVGGFRKRLLWVVARAIQVGHESADNQETVRSAVFMACTAAVGIFS